MIQRLMSWLAILRYYLKLTGAMGITRRYVAMNGFDGTSTALGVVVGLALGGTIDPRTVMNACVGASVAMGISGLWGAYIAERAERKRQMDELEFHMKRDLSGSVLDRASTATAVWVSVVDAFAAALPGLVPAVPFVLASWGWLSVEAATLVAVAACVMLLFFLGTYIGRVSGENPWVHGALMVATGLLIVAVVSLLL